MRCATATTPLPTAKPPSHVAGVGCQPVLVTRLAGWLGCNDRNLRADQVNIPRECPRPAAASSAGSGQTATSSLSCCKNLPAGRNVVPALLLQRQLRDDVAVKSQGLRQQRDDV